MLFSSPEPIAAAVDRLESKTPVGSPLTSAQWQEIDVALRDRAFFSARVEDVRIVSEMQSRIDDALKLVRRDGGAFMDRSRFIGDMRSLLGAQPGDSGKLTDITSGSRLGLVYDFNTEDAMAYGRWLSSQDPDALDAYPCDELIRVEDRKVPRGFRKGKGGVLIEVPEESWPARWQAAGGTFVDGRMIALKNDRIWTAISRFGRPWPPFDFNSGMGLADISRAESESLGVIAPRAPAPKPRSEPFNTNLQATMAEVTPAIEEAFHEIFGDQVDVRDGKIIWRGDRIRELTRAALDRPQSTESLDLGQATPDAIRAAGSSQFGGGNMRLDAASIRAIDSPMLSELDFRLVPQIWRAPDEVEALSGGGLVFTKRFLGRTASATFRRDAGDTWTLATLEVQSATKGGAR